MTPELPRAPMSDPCTMASQVAPNPGSARASSSVVTDSTVSAMLVPVSPSGTGKTLSRLMSSWWVRRPSR